MCSSDLPLTGAADSVALDYQAKSDDASTTTPAIVSTGSVTLSADDVRAAHDRVLRVVRGLDGTVDQDTMDTDTAGAVTTSHLVVRVPSATPAQIAASAPEAFEARLGLRDAMAPLLDGGWQVTAVDRFERTYTLSR